MKALVLTVTRSMLSSAFLSFFLGALFYLYLVDANSLLFKSLLVMFGVGFVLVERRSLNVVLPANKSLFVFFLFFWLVSVLFVFFNNARFEVFYFILLELVSVALAHMLVRNKVHHFLLIRFYWVFVFFVSLLCLLDFMGLHQYEGALLGGASVNYSTSLLLGLSLLLVALSFMREGVYKYLYLVPVVLISIYLNSRFSAIVASSAFLFVFIFSIFRGNSWARVICFGFAFSVIFLLLIFYDSLNLIGYVLSDPRIIIWGDYFGSVKFLNYMYGVEFRECCSIISDVFRNNPHNSIIRSFSIFGLGAFFYLLIIFTVVIVSVLFSQARFVGGIFMFWVIRCLTDSIAIPYYFDFIFFSLFFIVFNVKKIHNYDALKGVG